MLTTGFAVQVPYAAPQQQASLSAAFENAPASHDASSPFSIELAFSEAVFTGDEAFNKNQYVADAISVTNGTLNGRRRVNPQQYDRWRLRIRPSGNGDVTVSLPATTSCSASGAICTPGGTPLSGSTTATIQGPPGLAVADATVQEAPGANLAFVVTLSRAASGAVSVDYATSDDSATAGADYTETSGALTFASGETSKTVSVPVLDDAVDEGNETLNFTLSNPSGAYLADATAVGTIENSDPMPAAATVRIAREIGSQLVEAVNARLEGGGETQVTVGGLSLTGNATLEDADEPRALGLPEWDSRQRRDAATKSLTREQLLLDSSFSFSSGEAGPGTAAFGAWGHVAIGSFDAEEDDVTVDGEVRTGLIGADLEWDRAMAGLILSHSRGDGAFKGENSLGGEYESTLTGVYPYARVGLTESVAVWGLVGGGSGELTLRSGGMVIETDQSMRVGAVGLTGRVLEPAQPGDSRWTFAPTQCGSRPARTRCRDRTGTWSRPRPTRPACGQSSRASVRSSSRTEAPSRPSARSAFGTTAATPRPARALSSARAFATTSGPLTIEGQVRTLVAHEDSGYEEWGASGSIRVQPSESGRGMSLSLAPVWGEAASGAERLWAARDARELDPSDTFEPEGRLEAEVGYGLPVRHTRGLLTPYAGLTLAGEGAQRVRAGTRWDLAPGAAVGLEGVQADGDRAVELRLQMTW